MAKGDSAKDTPSRHLGTTAGNVTNAATRRDARASSALHAGCLHRAVYERAQKVEALVATIHRTSPVVGLQNSTGSIVLALQPGVVLSSGSPTR
jgi:hypothetical protein